MSDKLLEENGFLVIDSDDLGDTDPMDIVREIYAQRSRDLWKGVDTSRATKIKPMTTPTSTPLERAEVLARAAHASQRYGDLPYAVHLAAVAATALRFGITTATPEGEALLCAAWLHDTLEDTPLEAYKILEIGTPGPLTLELVQRVTDEPGNSRDEKKQATYPKIAAHPLAVLLKLADRIANVEACIRDGVPHKLERYRSEHPSFRAALYPTPDSTPDPTQNPTRGEIMLAMWAHLDALLEEK